MIRLRIKSLMWLCASLITSDAFVGPMPVSKDDVGRSTRSPTTSCRTSLEQATSATNNSPGPSAMAVAFDSINRCRYACTRFRRHAEQRKSNAADQMKDTTAQGTKDNTKQKPRATASVSDLTVVRQALHCLNMARRAPSGFNSQPYRLLMVSSEPAKEALALCCHGRNADRVRDSDCTILFLADREWGRDMSRFGTFLDERPANAKLPPMGKWVKRKIQILVLMFSSGYPFPRLIASPMSFIVRFVVGLVGTVTRRRILMPTLSSAETWATKNTMLVAMSYMLAATSRGLATCPMEGVWAQGVRRALGIPRRYAIPLIVSTGTPYHSPTDSNDETEGKQQIEEDEPDDVGMAHGAGSGKATPRYPLRDVVFADTFGEAALLPP
mmetsp:Transcript_16419/g.35671  ORF Transcript_16419/g.35671 Transcript_16419/m.35671 type:complete len:384 (+) Transcript_16419:83-1234(+)